VTRKVPLLVECATRLVVNDQVSRGGRDREVDDPDQPSTSCLKPPLGTGAGNLTLEDAAEIMATGLHAHRGNAQFPADVSFVVERAEDQQVFEAALQRATS
jgi:O-acetyl-ADP-ribose deacetylase (regulator of RNase III)